MSPHQAFALAMFFVSGGTTVACEELYDAAAMGELERVLELVSSTNDVAACKDKWGFTPLHGVVTGHGSVTEDDLTIAQTLIDHGANVEAKTDTGATPLMICPYPELIELLVDNGADLEATDNSGATALLYYAGDSNGPAALKRALALGANPNHSDKRGRTALQIAIARSEDDKVQILRQFGAK
ncbi:MAG: ankyrin repeat domain-containing protein [Pseudomonadota bacterium]